MIFKHKFFLITQVPIYDAGWMTVEDDQQRMNYLPKNTGTYAVLQNALTDIVCESNL